MRRVAAIASINKPKYDSSTEAAFAEVLKIRFKAGTILEWAHKPEKLRLADNAWYTPDFRIVELDGRVRFYEVKGFWREAAKVRLKVAADRHPYLFTAVYYKQKAWTFEEFSCSGS